MKLIKRLPTPISNSSRRILALPVAIGVLFALSLGGIALGQSTTFTACLSAKGTLHRVAIGTEPVSPCKTGEQQVSWNLEGPAGPPGPAGAGGATVAKLELGARTGAGGCSSGTDYHTIGVGCPGSEIAGGEFVTAEEVDPADYPTGAVATLWTVMLVNPNDTLCVRLFDLTAETAVTNSERCSTNSATSSQFSRGSASPIELQTGGLYVLQIKHSGAFMGSGALDRAQLVIDWD